MESSDSEIESEADVFNLPSDDEDFYDIFTGVSQLAKIRDSSFVSLGDDDDLEVPDEGVYIIKTTHKVPKSSKSFH